MWTIDRAKKKKENEFEIKILKYRDFYVYLYSFQRRSKS